MICCSEKPGELSSRFEEVVGVSQSSLLVASKNELFVQIKSANAEDSAAACFNVAVDLHASLT